MLLPSTFWVRFVLKGEVSFYSLKLLLKAQVLRSNSHQRRTGATMPILVGATILTTRKWNSICKTPKVRGCVARCVPLYGRIELLFVGAHSSHLKSYTALQQRVRKITIDGALF